MATSSVDLNDEIDYSDIEAKCAVSPPKLHCSTCFFSRYRVEYDDGLDNTLVVDGIPVIDKSKLEKLLAKVAKEFSKKGCPIKPDDIFVPWDDSTGKSKGCAHPASLPSTLPNILSSDLPSSTFAPPTMRTWR